LFIFQLPAIILVLIAAAKFANYGEKQKFEA
jgi:hypothetical protein